MGDGTIETVGRRVAGAGPRRGGWTSVLTIAVSMALLVLIWRPFLTTPTYNFHGVTDWRFRANYMSYTVKSLFTAHAVPLWATGDRYHQLWFPESHGFLSNPETEVLSPYVILYGVLPFGEASRASLLLHLLIGVAGLYMLLGLFGVRSWPCMALCSVLLFGSGFFVRHVLVGHLQFFSYTYFPAVLWLYFRAVRSSRFDSSAWASLVGAGGIVALAYYEGNANLVVQFLFTIAALSVITAIVSPGERLRALAAGPAVIASFAIIAAAKLLPGIAEYGGYRPNDLNMYRSVGQFLQNVLYCVPWPPWPVPHELAFYLGVTGAVVIALGLLHVRRATLPIFLLSLLLLLLLFAPFGQVISYVPALNTQRPTRLRGEFLLLAVVLSADALTRIGNRVSRWRPGLTRILFAVLVVALAALVTRDQADAMRTLVRAHNQEVVKRHDLWLISLHDAAIDPPVARLREGGGTITTTGEGPNGFSIAYSGAASPAEPAVIVLPGVTSREASLNLAVKGGERTEAGGRLAVRVISPNARIEVRYSSRWMNAGIGLTVLGLVLLAGLLASGRRRQ